MSAAAVLELTDDDLYPRDELHRWRIYAVTGDERRVLATSPTAAGIGVALVTMHEDARSAGRRLVDEGRIGVLDCLPGGKPSPTGEWLVSPYDRMPA